MRQIGSLMAFLGAFAIVLNFFDRVPRLLIWIYSWGETTAWIIKIALIVVGGALYFMGTKSEEEVESVEEE